MFSKTVRWGISIAALILMSHSSSPTAFADTILEIPRSDARLFCADELTSTPLVTPESKKPNLLPSLHQQKPTSSLNSDILFDIINNYRISIGLPAFQKDSAICEIAKQRGPQLDYEVEAGMIHAGFRALELPYWATENVKYGGNEQDMFHWWMNSSIHRQALIGDYKYSCGECFGKSCTQIFTNYVAK